MVEPQGNPMSLTLTSVVGSALSAGKWVIGILWPKYKVLSAARHAGAMPDSVSSNELSDFLAQAYKDWFVPTADNGVASGIGNRIIRGVVVPEFLTTPSVREWLKRHEVEADFIALAENKLRGSQIDETSIRRRLAESYSNVTLDHSIGASGPIDHVIGMLHAASKERMEQSGKVRAGLTQSIGALHSEEHGEIKVAIEEVKSRIDQNRNTGIALHHSEDAREQLSSILIRRAVCSPKIIIQQLRSLLADMEPTGRLSGASADIQIDAYYWLFRLLAAEGSIAEVAEVREKISTLDPARDLRIPDAWLIYHSGDQLRALQLIRDITSADGKSSLMAMLRTGKKVDEALSWLSSQGDLSPASFTGIGWRNIAITYAERGDALKGIELLTKLDELQYKECPYLIHILGVLHCIQLVVPERRVSAFYNGLWDAGEFLQTKEANTHLQNAIACFEKAKAIPDIYLPDEVKRETSDWLTWARLLDPNTKEIEQERIRQTLRDPAAAIDILPFAIQFDLEFPTNEIASYLDRREAIGGLSNEEFQARFLLVRKGNDPQRIADFIEQNFDRLISIGNEAGLTGFLIQALAASGQYEKAEEILHKKRDRLYPADVARFEAQIISCRGGDPIEKLIENYNRAENSYVDLVNLVSALRGAKRWGDLSHYARDLYSTIPNVENAGTYLEALRKLKADHIETVEFCAQNIDVIQQSDELLSIYAWSLFWTGDVSTAKDINEKLVAGRHFPQDIGLEINIALRSGEWSHFNIVMEREWEGRANLPVEILLNLATFTTITDQVRVLQLCREVVEREGSNPDILVRAHHIAVKLGKDDFAMPLIHRAAELSKEEGPVKSFATREMITMMREQAEEWHRKVDLAESGGVPIHIAASALNLPLSHFFLKIPRNNESLIDGRAKGYIAVQSGKRQIKPVTDFSSLGLDVTSALLLLELNCIDDVISMFDRVYLSPRFMEFLFHEMEQVRFHQPSRIAEAKALISFVHDRKIETIDLESSFRSDEIASSVVEEVGQETAILLSKAQKTNGYFVHIGPIYKPGAYLEELANVSALSEIIVSPRHIVSQIFDAGLITEINKGIALGYLGQLEASVDERSIDGAKALYLDDEVLPSLHKAGVLQIMLQTGRKIFISSRQYEEWKELIKLEGHADSLTETLDELRRKILQGVKTGKIHWFNQARWELEDGRLTSVESPVFDLISSAGEAAGICIDDAFMNKENAVTDRSGKTVPLISSIDIFGALVSKSIWTIDTYIQKLHLMRKKGFGAVPVSTGEIIKLIKDRPLGDGEIKESAELIAIRQNIASFHSHIKRKSRDDLNYMDALWRNGYQAIQFFWLRTEADAEDAALRTAWIYEHIMPDLESAFPLDYGQDRADKMFDVGAKRLMAFLVPEFTHQDRNKRYKEWLETTILPTFYPLFPQLTEKAALYLSEHILSWSSELANEHEKSDS